MEQYELARDMDPPPTTGNALDIEECIANFPITNVDDYPIYDSEEEESTAGSHQASEFWWPWLRTKLNHHKVVVKDYIWPVLQLLAPIPHPTKIPDRMINSMPGGQVQAKRFKAPKGKRIHVPVRVEPKVYFAAERTFLSWLEFGIILGSIAATLLNFGDRTSLYSAWGFTAVACVALLYSCGLYLWRVRMIQRRRAVRYHDSVGPTILCFGLLVAVAINFGLRFG